MSEPNTRSGDSESVRAKLTNDSPTKRIHEILDVQWCQEKKWLDVVELAGGAQVLQLHYDFNVALWMKMYRCMRVEFDAYSMQAKFRFFTFHLKTKFFRHVVAPPFCLKDSGSLPKGSNQAEAMWDDTVFCTRLEEEKPRRQLGGQPPALDIPLQLKISTGDIGSVRSIDAFSLWQQHAQPRNHWYLSDDRRLLEKAAVRGDFSRLRYWCTKEKVLTVEKYQRLLNYAAGNGRLDCVEFLLSLGADVHYVELGHRPLTWAAYHGQDDVVALLCAKGVDVNLGTTTTPSKTAIQWARERLSRGGAGAIGTAVSWYENVISILREHGAEE